MEGEEGHVLPDGPLYPKGYLTQDSAILQVGYPGCRIAAEGSNTHKGPEAIQSKDQETIQTPTEDPPDT